MMTGDQQALWEEAWELLRVEKNQAETDGKAKYIDYGFIVFPAAKVYEGFLKSYFYQMGLVSKGAYLSDHFRIGKALNPDLPFKYRNHTWVFDDLSRLCGFGTARQLWEAWKLARNRVFHYDAREMTNLNLTEAEERLTVLKEAMRSAAACEIRVKRD